jgi:putative Holliday junction resolvase
MALKHLGIDFGSKRIGLAISDDTASVAFPYKTVLNTPKAFDEIIEIINFEHIAKVIIGESKDKDMKENPIMELVHAFKKQLDEKNIDTEFHNEFFSSAQVLSTMGQQNKAIDASAAAIILQSYLDLHKAMESLV